MAHAASAFPTLPAITVFKGYIKKKNAPNFTSGSEKYYRKDMDVFVMIHSIIIYKLYAIFILEQFTFYYSQEDFIR
jgi:hypothetical protein